MSVPVPKFVQAKKTTLKVPISASESSAIVLTRLVDIYGNALAATDFNAPNLYGFCTINPGADDEEIVRFSGFTQNSDGSCTLDTGITRGVIAKSPYTTAGTGLSHAAGSVVVFGDNPQVYQYLVDYINAVSIAGAPPASTTVEGLVEEATDTEIDADTELGATTVPLFVNPAKLATSKYGTRLPSAGQKDALAGTPGTPSASNKYLTADAIATVPVVRTYLAAASPATWSKPAGLKYVVVEVQAAGGAGGSSSTGGSDIGAAGGGGAGGYARKTIAAGTLGATETVTIGASGNPSSFGSHASATSGSGGQGSVTGAGGTGGTASSGDINAAGQAGTNGSADNAAGTTRWGGVGGAGHFGGGGAGATGSNSAGVASGNYGGGGGGGTGSSAGGAGGPAIVIVTEYYN